MFHKACCRLASQSLSKTKTITSKKNYSIFNNIRKKCRIIAYNHNSLFFLFFFLKFIHAVYISFQIMYFKKLTNKKKVHDHFILNMQNNQKKKNVLNACTVYELIFFLIIHFFDKNKLSWFKNKLRESALKV
jgi:hypothetical protein